MNCREIREFLPLHAYGDLLADEKRNVEAHLAGCRECETELAALGTIRDALSSTSPVPARVELATVYRAEARRLRRRTRRWRFAAAISAAAVVIALAIRLEVRVNQRQLTIRWGTAEPELVVQHVPQEMPRPERAIPSELEARIKTMSEIIQTLAANVDASDRERQEQISNLKLELAAMKRQSQERMSETERDLSALYAAHFGSRPKAVNP